MQNTSSSHHSKWWGWSSCINSVHRQQKLSAPNGVRLPLPLVLDLEVAHDEPHNPGRPFLEPYGSSLEQRYRYITTLFYIFRFFEGPSPHPIKCWLKSDKNNKRWVATQWVACGIFLPPEHVELRFSVFSNKPRHTILDANAPIFETMHDVNNLSIKTHCIKPPPTYCGPLAHQNSDIQWVLPNRSKFGR